MIKDFYFFIYYNQIMKPNTIMPTGQRPFRIMTIPVPSDGSTIAQVLTARQEP